jgi:16S rRNA (guanine966-N2)-methyltransferase
VRIVRGIYKARRFSPPKTFPSRPTTDFAKEGIFNVMENRYSLVNLNILDLCAGTGNISIEFLSREAGNVTSVDKHPVCIKYMYKLKKELGIEDEWHISKNEVRNFLDNCRDTYDLIFADPPYALTFHDSVVRIIRERKLLKPGGICIVEHGKQTDLSQESGFLETRNFGNVYFSFFQFE